MTAPTKIRTDDEHLDLLHRLLAARGIEWYGLYLLTSEHKVTPSGFEEMSGYVVHPDGRAHFFWTGWHDDHQVDGFTIWRDAEHHATWDDDDEYQAALAAARVGDGPVQHTDGRRVG